MTKSSGVVGTADEALALCASRGDVRAFHTLYLRHSRDVRASVTRLIGIGPDREDVTQEVFLQLYRALPKFRGEARLSTFLRRITMHVALDHVRRRYRDRRMAGDDDALDTVADAGQGPEQQSSARQQLHAVLRHLDGIALDQRHALLLVAIAGLSLDDAAVCMGANSGWVKQRVIRARRELAARTARRPLRRSHGHDAGSSL